MTTDATDKAKAVSSSNIRKIQYYTLFFTLLLDAYASKGECLLHLTIWSWILHILYFEIRLGSDSIFLIKLLHGPSLGGSLALFLMYIWTLVVNPQMEFDLAPVGRATWFIYVRAIWLHVIPVLYHYIDYTNTTNKSVLSNVYEGTKDNTALKIWSCVGGYLAMGLVWEQVVAAVNGDDHNPSDVYNVKLVSPEVYINVSKVLGIGSCVLIYLLYIKPLMT